MEFTPRGHEVWVSVRDAGKVMVYDTHSFEKLARNPGHQPLWHLLYRARSPDGVVNMEFVTDPLDARLLDDWQRDLPITAQPFAADRRGAGAWPRPTCWTGWRGCARPGRITRVGGHLRAQYRLGQHACRHRRAHRPDRGGGARSSARNRASTIPICASTASTCGSSPPAPTAPMSMPRWPGSRHAAGLRVLDLRLVRPFNVDLGFSLSRRRQQAATHRAPVHAAAMMPGDRQILQALTSGMELIPRPLCRHRA